MRTVRIIEGLDYPEEIPCELPYHHILTCEIAARLQELDELLPGNGKSQGGIRLMNRLSSVERRSTRAYRLILDMLTQQLSLSSSFEDLGARKDHSRQSWLQNAQSDIETIKSVWPEIGVVMEELIRRRTTEDAAS